MRTSLILSVLLHIAILSAALLSFTSSTRIETNNQPISIELISPSDITQVRAGKKNAEEKDAARAAPPQEKKAEPTPPPKAPEPKPVDKIAEKQAVAPPPPPKPAEPEHKPEPEKKVAAKPEPVEPPKRAEPPKETPKPKPEKQAEAKPKKPEPKPEAKPEPKPEATPEPERDTTPFRDRVAGLLKHPAEEDRKPQPAPPVQTKRDFDPDRIQALLNRDPKAGAPAAAQEAPKEPARKPSSFQEQALGMDQPAAPPREALGAPSGQDARMSVNEIDAFVAQISRCWTPPVGGLGGEAIVVKLRIELKQDGSLVKPPQIANAGNSPFFTAAADSAMRAVFQCQPYTMPQEKFSQWRDMLLNFDPRRMYGG